MAFPAPVAVVTGGSRGIGAAIAERLATDGFTVAINYVGNRAAAEDVAERIAAAGGTALALQGDVRNAGHVVRLVSRATELGPLTVLVNNSGISGAIGRHDEKHEADLRELVEVDVLGVMLTCREAVRVMSTRHGGPGGSIVNIASVSARTGRLAGLASYAATKGAVVTFSRGLSSEVAAEGIRVNSVSPGTVETDMTTDDTRRVGRTTPMGRLGRPEEIAGAVSWLVSSDAAYVTGTDITVGGGRYGSTLAV